VSFPAATPILGGGEGADSPSLAALHRATATGLGYGGYGGAPLGTAAAAVEPAANDAEPAPATEPDPAAVEPAATAGPRPVPDAGDRRAESAERPREADRGGAEESAAAPPAADRGSRTPEAVSPGPERGRRAPAPSSLSTGGSGEPHGAGVAAAVGPAQVVLDAARAAADRAREKLRSWLASDPRLVGLPGAGGATTKANAAIDAAADAAFEWAERVRDTSAAWFHAEGGKWIGPETWRELSRAADDRPGLPVNLDRKPVWLPFEAIVRAMKRDRPG
jgi:hypothetical protein